MMPIRHLIRLAAFAIFPLSLVAALFAQPEDEEEDENLQEDAAVASALDRLEKDAQSRGAGKAAREREKAIDLQANKTALRNLRIGPDSPLFRNGVPYLEDWEFRAGATKLLIPAYGNWVNFVRNRKVYESFLQQGEPGEFLAAALVDRGFVKRTRSPFINFYGLIWVPQGEAYKVFEQDSFESIKDEVKARIVAMRRDGGIQREDFDSFQDYINFKIGKDQAIENFIDDALVLVSDAPDSLIYFHTALNRYSGKREVTQEPMISTVAFALVQGKYLRFTFTRQFLTDEDAQGLVAFTVAFIDDMRRLNGLSKDRRVTP